MVRGKQLLWLGILLALPFALAYEVSWQGSITKIDGTTPSGNVNITFEINQTNGNNIYTELFQNECRQWYSNQVGCTFDIILGRTNHNLSLVYNELYYVGIFANNQLINNYFNWTASTGIIKGNNINLSSIIINSSNLNITSDLDMNGHSIVDTTQSYVNINKNVTIAGWLNILTGQIFFTNILSINGTSLPSLDSIFDLGSSLLRWRNGYFSGNVSANAFVGDGQGLTNLNITTGNGLIYQNGVINGTYTNGSTYYPINNETLWGMFSNLTDIRLRNISDSYNDSFTYTIGDRAYLNMTSFDTRYIGGGYKIFYFTNHTADISGLYNTSLSLPTTPKAEITQLVVGGETNIASFISEPVSTDYQVLPGAREFHIKAKVDSVAKETRLRGYVYTANLTGGDLTILRNSTLSMPLTLNEEEYSMTVLGTALNINTSTRIIFNITSNLEAGGPAVLVSIFVDDDTFSRLEVPSPVGVTDISGKLDIGDQRYNESNKIMNNETISNVIDNNSVIRNGSNVNFNNIGIGLIYPQSKLHVNGTGALLNVSNNSNSFLYVTDQNGGGVGIGTIDKNEGGTISSRLTVRQADSSTGLAIYNIAGSRRFAVNPTSEGWTIYDGQSGAWVAGISQKAGRIGIGTISPANKLEVDGTINATRINASTSFILDGKVLNSWGELNMSLSNDTARATYMNITGGTFTGGINGTDAAFSGNVGIGAPTPAYRLEINSSNAALNVSGNLYANSTSVGIGLSSPSVRLHVYGTPGTILVQDSRAAAGFGGKILIGSNGYANESGFGQNFAGIYGSLVNGASASTGDLRFATRNGATDASLTDRMTILANGKIGIGTTAPANKLEVIGNISSTTNISAAESFILGGRVINSWDSLNATMSSTDNTSLYSFFMSNYSAALNLVNKTQLMDNQTIANALLNTTIARIDQLNSNETLFKQFMNITGGNFTGGINGSDASFSGKVGIGTISPSQKLEISANSVNSDLGIRLSYSPDTSYYNEIVQHYIGAEGFSLNFNAHNQTGYNGTPLSIRSNGNIGINTTTPQMPIHIGSMGTSNTPLAAIGMMRAFTSDTVTRGSAIFHYYDQASGDNNEFFAIGVSGIMTGASTNRPDQLSQAKMVVRADGNVGINTTKPASRLEVIGNISSTTNISAVQAFILNGDVIHDWTEVNGTVSYPMNNATIYNYVSDQDYLNDTKLYMNITGGKINGNLTIRDYIEGQPITGSIGSGIIWANGTNSFAEVNVSCSGLTCSWTDFKVRLINTSNDVNYCDIAAGSLVIPSDQHSVLYVDKTCTVQITSIQSYISAPLSPGGIADFANIISEDGNTYDINGLGIENKRIIKLRKLLLKTMHLDIINGFAKSEGTFPKFNVSAGEYVYLMDTVPTSNVDTSVNYVEGIYHTSATTWGSADWGGLNVTFCDTGTSTSLCTNTGKYRRIFIFMLGYNETTDGTVLHQLLPLQNRYYNTQAECLNTINNPLTYTLPTFYQYGAVMLYAYCARPSDTNWDSAGWIDLRTVKQSSATGGSDTSGYVPYSGAARNVDLGIYNLSTSGNITATSICSNSGCIGDKANASNLMNNDTIDAFVSARDNDTDRKLYLNISNFENGTYAYRNQIMNNQTIFNLMPSNQSIANALINTTIARTNQLMNNQTVFSIITNGTFADLNSYNIFKQPVYFSNNVTVMGTINLLNATTINFVSNGSSEQRGNFVIRQDYPLNGVVVNISQSTGNITTIGRVCDSNGCIGDKANASNIMNNATILTNTDTRYMNITGGTFTGNVSIGNADTGTGSRQLQIVSEINNNATLGLYEINNGFGINFIYEGISNTFQMQRVSGNPPTTIMQASKDNNNIFFPSNGSVGIGISAVGSPEKKLDVNGDIRIRGDNATLNFYRTSSPSDIAYIAYDNGGRLNITANNKDIVFSSKINWVESARITSTGLMGIGTSTPDKSLTVIGDINTTGDLFVNGGVINGGYNMSLEIGETSNIFGFSNGTGVNRLTLSTAGSSYPLLMGYTPAGAATLIQMGSGLYVSSGTTYLAGALIPRYFIYNDQTNAPIWLDDNVSVRGYLNVTGNVSTSDNFILNGNYIHSWGELNMSLTNDTARATYMNITGGKFTGGINGTDAAFSGRVGIGTTIALSPLQVVIPTFSSHDTNSQHVIISNAAGSGHGVRIGFNPSDGGVTAYGVINVLNPSVAWGRLILQDGGGIVGIGTMTPAYTLDVNGTIKSRGDMYINNSPVCTPENGYCNLSNNGLSQFMNITGGKFTGGINGTDAAFSGEVGIGIQVPTTALYINSSTGVSIENKLGSGTMGPVIGYAGGSLAMGAIDTSLSSAYVITGITAMGKGSLAKGYIYALDGSNTSFINASGAGSIASGYVVYYGNISATGSGSIATGYATGMIRASGSGSFAGGYIMDKTNSILASNSGSFAYGYMGSSTGGTITASSAGSIALGYASAISKGGIVKSSGSGSLAAGFSNGISDQGALLSSGAGSIALGAANYGNITASSTGSVAFGDSTSSLGILSSGGGSTAFGYANQNPARIVASNSGSIAGGYAYYSQIESSGVGSVALGRTAVSGSGQWAALNASGAASVAIGDNVTAQADNAITLGKNVWNTESNSFAVGFNSTPELIVKGESVQVKDTLCVYGGTCPAINENGAYFGGNLSINNGQAGKISGQINWIYITDTTRSGTTACDDFDLIVPGISYTCKACKDHDTGTARTCAYTATQRDCACAQN